MRKIALLLVLACAAGCSNRFPLFRPSRDVQPRTVGVILPLSGPYQRVGESLLEGVRLGFKASEVRLVVRDSKGEAAEAERAVESLVREEEAIALLGGVAQDEAAAAAQRAEALGVPLLTFSKSDDATSAGNYVFRNMMTVREQGAAIGRYATCQLGLKAFAWLGPDAEYARELEEAFMTEISEYGGGVARKERYAAGQTTFTAEAKKLTGRFEPERRADYAAREREIVAQEPDPFRRRKALDKLKQSLTPQVDYDGLFVADGWQAVSLIAPALAVEDLVTQGCDAEAMSRLSKAMGREPSRPVRLLGWGGWGSPVGKDGVPELLVRGGRHLQCATYVDGFFAGSERPATRRFVTAFRGARGGETPGLLQAVGYDSAQIFRQIIERDAPPDSARFQNLLASLRGFEGATGTTAFDGQRNAVKPLFVLEIGTGGIREQAGRKDCRPEWAGR
ncbi:MAG TPA: ABC transporter substrate-binding protein [Myxococcaceae bacterium]|nr:ABC transporter substrate-binding protein [Myxococcaceae bacterium]